MLGIIRNPKENLHLSTSSAVSCLGAKEVIPKAKKILKFLFKILILHGAIVTGVSLHSFGE